MLARSDRFRAWRWSGSWTRQRRMWSIQMGGEEGRAAGEVRPPEDPGRAAACLPEATDFGRGAGADRGRDRGVCGRFRWGVKKAGRREKFDRQKILGGLLHACQKRPISGVALERIVDETEAYVVDSAERERSTREIGELIMERLKEIDTVSYIRFASVYRDFKDVREFKLELEDLLSGKDAKKKGTRY